MITDKPVERVVFNEITKNAVLHAMETPRKINSELVEAYLARRALDHLIGFSISPILWRKLPGSKSAGRVQSVALKLICEREIEIEKFNIEEYILCHEDLLFLFLIRQLLEHLTGLHQFSCKLLDLLFRYQYLYPHIIFGLFA